MWYNKYVKRGTQDQKTRNSGQADTILSRTVRTDSLGWDSETILLSMSRSCIRKIVANIFRKPLDKNYIIWYNISVKERYYI